MVNIQASLSNIGNNISFKSKNQIKENFIAARESLAKAGYTTYKGPGVVFNRGASTMEVFLPDTRSQIPNNRVLYNVNFTPKGKLDEVQICRTPINPTKFEKREISEQLSLVAGTVSTMADRGLAPRYNVMGWLS